MIISNMSFGAPSSGEGDDYQRLRHAEPYLTRHIEAIIHDDLGVEFYPDELKALKDAIGWAMRARVRKKTLKLPSAVPPSLAVTWGGHALLQRGKLQVRKQPYPNGPRMQILLPDVQERIGYRLTVETYIPRFPQDNKRFETHVLQRLLQVHENTLRELGRTACLIGYAADSYAPSEYPYWLLDQLAADKVDQVRVTGHGTRPSVVLMDGTDENSEYSNN